MRTIQSIVVAVAMLAATMLLAANANAQCAVTPGIAPLSKAATFLEKSAAAPKPAAVEKPQFFGFFTIIGFWHSTFTVGTTVVDDGFAEWHSDGTEILNSLRDPRTGAFCMGVWQPTGRYTYKLNHFGLAWDGNGNFVGPANIQESITVSSDGKAYTGTFTVDQYDTDGNDIQHVAGNVAATRILVSTTIQEIYGW
jgi:hypothetical protein